MVTIITREDVELNEFEAWSGGRDVLDKILEHSKVDMIIDIIENYLMEYEELSSTDVNDFLWFEIEDILRDEYDIDIWEE